MVVGITNALNVVADALGEAPPDLAALNAAAGGDRAPTLLADLRASSGRSGVPLPYGLMARDPAYASDVVEAVKRAFGDHRLSRRLKESLAFAVALTSRSRVRAPLHLAAARAGRGGGRGG